MTQTQQAQQAQPPTQMSRDEALRMVADWLGPRVSKTTRQEQSWQEWLTFFFHKWVSNKLGELVSFGPHHRLYWEWLWDIKVGVKPNPFVGIWARGGAKSTSVELGVVSLAARGVRKYCLYICATQEQADDHIQNIGSLLESDEFAKGYPGHSQRLVGKYGSSKGWRRNRLRTAAGFTADAIGLDTAARGVKLENLRPDVIVLDDIDEEVDSSHATEKKIAVLTRKLLPTGSSDCVVIAIQNKVIPDGIFARLAIPTGQDIDGLKSADFLQDRIVSGPIPAVLNAKVIVDQGKYKLVGGEPTWAGQDLKVCQAQIGEWGYSSWLIEAQHEVDTLSGGLFEHVDFERLHVLPGDVPELVSVVVWVDPAVTATDRSDSHGIQVDGLGADNRIYRLRSWEGISSPTGSLKRAITWALEFGATTVGVETDQGGDLWETAYYSVWDQMVDEGEVHLPVGIPPLNVEPNDLGGSYTKLKRNYYGKFRPGFKTEKAGAGYGPKAQRASRMLVDYEDGDIFRHVLGTHDVLERALKRFPLRKPFDLVDASFWCWNDLKGNMQNGVGARSDPPPPHGTYSTRDPSTPPQVQTPLGYAGRVGRLWAGHSSKTMWRQPSAHE